MSGLNDLTKHLFAQLDRLQNSEGDFLAAEIERSKAVSDVAKTIISAADVHLGALKLAAEYNGVKTKDVERLIGSDESTEADRPRMIRMNK